MTTPAPRRWHVSGSPYGAVVSDDPSDAGPAYDDDALKAYGGFLIAEGINPKYRGLIAAAPEMLDALHGLLAEIAAYGEPEDAIREAVIAARAAVANAEVQG